MTKTKRKIIFWSLVIIFLIISPLIAFYAIGYRYNFQTGEITETGGIFLKATPSQAKTFINNKSKKETSFFGGSMLIDNLSPKTYTVKLEKDGYRSWEKKLTVLPKFVTEARNIILIPKNPQIIKISDQKISDFLFSRNNQLIALKINFDEKEKSPNHKIGILNTENSSFIIAILPEKNIDFEINEWSYDNNSLLLNLKEKNTNKWFILKKISNSYELFEIFKKAFVDSAKKAAPAKNRAPKFNPQNSAELFFLDENDLKTFNYDTGILSKAILTDVEYFEIANGYIHAVKNDGLLYKSNLNGDNKTQLSQKPIKLDSEKKLNAKLFISKQNNAAIIDAFKNLYLYENKKNVFYQIDKNAENLEFSEDNEKIIYNTNNEIKCYYLENIFAQPFKNTGETEQIIANFSQITDVKWYSNNYHLFFHIGDLIKLTDLDGRDKRNIIDLTESNGSKIYFNDKNKKLYYTNNQELYNISIE